MVQTQGGLQSRYPEAADTTYFARLEELSAARILADSGRIARAAAGKKPDDADSAGGILEEKIQILQETLRMIESGKAMEKSFAGISESDEFKGFKAFVAAQLEQCDAALKQLDKDGAAVNDDSPRFRPTEPLSYWQALLRLTGEATQRLQDFADLGDAPLLKAYAAGVEREKAALHKLLARTDDEPAPWRDDKARMEYSAISQGREGLLMALGEPATEEGQKLWREYEQAHKELRAVLGRQKEMELRRERRETERRVAELDLMAIERDMPALNDERREAVERVRASMLKLQAPPPE